VYLLIECTFIFRVQLYDLLGAVLNENSHKALMETLDFNDAKSVEKIERYLWSASIKFNPKVEIIKSNIHSTPRVKYSFWIFTTLIIYIGLLSITDEKLASKKIVDTLFNTVTSMASRLARYNHTDANVLVSIMIYQN